MKWFINVSIAIVLMVGLIPLGTGRALGSPPVALDNYVQIWGWPTLENFWIPVRDADSYDLIISDLSVIDPTYGTLSAGTAGCNPPPDDCWAEFFYTSPGTPPAEDRLSFTFQYQVSESDGTNPSNTANVVVSVGNDLPWELDYRWLASDTVDTTFALYGGGASELSFQIVSNPQHGTLGTPSAATCTSVEDQYECESTVIYTSDGNNGYFDSFQFVVFDGVAYSELSVMPFWVGSNSAPTAQDGSLGADPTVPSYITLYATDPDVIDFPSEETYVGDQVVFNIPTTTDGNGSLEKKYEWCDVYDAPYGVPWPDGKPSTCTALILYTPPASGAASDGFDFTVNDTHYESNSARISLTLRPPSTLTVNAIDDTTDGACDLTHCSLREAVRYARAGDSIDFNPQLSTIKLGGNPIIINKSLTINGPGADQLTISGDGLSRVVDVNEYSFMDINEITISGLTIRDGRADSGGGIRNKDSSLTLNDVVIGPNNIATNYGGGLVSRFGQLKLDSCTVTGNEAEKYSGGINIYKSDAILINTTVSGNTTDGYGGGISLNYANLTLIQSTISDNVANDDHYLDGYWGGIYHVDHGVGADNGILTTINSIIAGNTDSDSAGNSKYPDISSPAIASSGGNLVGDGTGSTGWLDSDQVGTPDSPIDPKLGALALNAPGHTPTHALLEGSPAIDAVTCAEGVTTDQRGVARLQGPLCDIGAYEWEDVTPPETTITARPANPSGNPNPSFSFESDETGSTFECKLEYESEFSNCDSPWTYNALAYGIHTFQVRAIDSHGNTDLTPASFTWTVDTSLIEMFSYITHAIKAGRTSNTITGLVTIQDNSGAPLSKATVTVYWKWNNVPLEELKTSPTSITRRGGVAKFVLRKMLDGDYTLCVDNVVKAGYSWDLPENRCETFTVPEPVP